MCKNNGSGFCFAIGILAGVIGGCIGAVLYAPQSGVKTRRDIKIATDEIKQKVSPEIREAKKQAILLIEASKCKIEKECKKIKDEYNAQKLAKAKNKEGDIYCL